MNTPYPTHIVAAAALVYNDNKILLVKSHYRGWEFPGGQVELGETPMEGAIREVSEESGINIKINHLVGIFSNTKSYYKGDIFIPTKVMFDFIGEYVSGELTTNDETSEVGWYTIDEAFNMIKTPAYVYRLKKILEYDGKVFCGAYSKRDDGGIDVGDGWYL